MQNRGEDKPNILLIIWDACRFDYAQEHANELTNLASENIWFEKAIAPSPWSLPSHASIFTGEYPHEHGCHRLDGTISTDLMEGLSEQGYSTYGISANGFASQRTGFHRGFDEFYYTGGREIYDDGLDVSGFAQHRLEIGAQGRLETFSDTTKEVLRHPAPFKSAANLLAVLFGELAQDYDRLQRVPHPIFAPDSGYCYSPRKNTRKLESIVEKIGNSPFFIFMNYLDTHRPYLPGPELQAKHLGEVLSFRELKRLNEEVAYPWDFLRSLRSGELNEGDVEKIRGLYAGEVETVDEQLGAIREILDDADLLEDTLIVVTSDHGENLGEADERGWVRMGHEGSVSDAVLRVPLLIAHPELEQRTLTEPVSLKDLYGLFLNGSQDLIESNGKEIRGLLPFEGFVSSQYPATGGEKFFEEYPEIPDELIEHRVAEHFAVAYDEQWKVIAESNGDRWAGTEDGEREIAEAPQRLVDVVEDHLDKLADWDVNKDLSQEDVSQLEALGYL